MPKISREHLLNLIIEKGNKNLMHRLGSTELELTPKAKDFSFLEIDGWDLSGGFDLNEAKFHYTDLCNVVFNGSKIRRANFTNSYGVGFDELCKAMHFEEIIAENDNFLNKDKKLSLDLVACYNQEIDEAESAEIKELKKKHLEQFINNKTKLFFKEERKLYGTFTAEREKMNIMRENPHATIIINDGKIKSVINSSTASIIQAITEDAEVEIDKIEKAKVKIECTGQEAVALLSNPEVLKNISDAPTAPLVGKVDNGRLEVECLSMYDLYIKITSSDDYASQNLGRK